MNLAPFPEINYIDGKSEQASQLLAEQLLYYLTEFKSINSVPIFVCIGSDRITGDSLGPLVGTYLRCSSFFPYLVYGTLSHPIHALNLKSSMEEILSRHPDNPIIAIDASLGSKRHLHYITIAPGSLRPGAGVNKVLMNVGDISITGITAPSGDHAHMILKSTRLSTVVALADRISKGILLACNSNS